MSVHSRKRSVTELNDGVGMKVSGSVDYSKESSSNYAIQFRNVRSNSMKVPERNCSEKLIFSRRTFRSSSRRTISGTSAVFSSSPSKPNEIHECHGDTSSSSSQTGKMEPASRQEVIISELLPTTKATQLTPVEHENHEKPKMKSCFIESRASGSSSAPVHSQKYIQPQYKASHSRLSFRSRTSTLKDNAQSSSFGIWSCTSTSDIIPSSCSSLDHYHSADSVRAQFHTGGSSSHRGIDVRQLSARDYSISSRNLNVPGESLADQLPAQELTRRVRNQPSNSDKNAVSVRTRRASSRESRMRSELKDEGPHSLSESVLDPHSLVTQFSFGDTVNTRSVQTSVEEPTLRVHTTGNSTSRHVYNDDRVTRSRYSRHSMHDSHGYQHIAMAEITEVLLALERIERARQLLSRESNFFFGSLVLHDQHRNMRMDIDNLTYEELLALEEKMGTVSIGLSEEMLSKCLKKGIYNHIPLNTQGCSSDDIKCSICQEEYRAGDEIGTLSCGHLYHVGCIQQWLRMKNWCPVCKVHAASSLTLNDP